MITLRNDFHNTSARVRPGRLSAATVRRVERALCGMRYCRCSGVLGVWGPQECLIELDSYYMDGTYAVSPKRAETTR